MAGSVGNAAGLAEQFNAFLLRTSDAPWFGTGLEIAKTGERYLLATTQEHHLMEGRSPVRVAGLGEEQVLAPGDQWATSAAMESADTSRCMGSPTRRSRPWA